MFALVRSPEQVAAVVDLISSDILEVFVCNLPVRGGVATVAGAMAQFPPRARLEAMT
jgi:hypothetical protein